MKRILLLTLLLGLSTCLCAEPAVTTEKKGGLDKETKGKVKDAVDKAVRFLRHSQNEQGHWGQPGITALALYAFFTCHRGYGPADGPWIRRPLEYLISIQREDGGFYIDQLGNYNTSVALLALTANPEVAKKYKNEIAKAQQYLIELQCDEGEGYTPEQDRFYGGIGYGGDERPDLSNTQLALEALHESGLDPEHPVYQKAVTFLERCQNRSESNDLAWSTDDGGFVYYPGSSKAGHESEAGQIQYRSYGSMTYAGIKSYIYANVGKDDPRVQAAYDWVRKHYDLSRNPGVGQQGLYYYYHTFAKTMLVWGTDFLVDNEGTAHNWREDLAQVLLATQRKDGSWVNQEDRWWENNPHLVTSYAILALSYCYEK